MPKLKGRTDMDASVLAQCVEMQSVPFNKLNLAARDAYGKIHRPQQARYMFQNIPNLSQSQKQMLVLDYAERSIKSKPLDIKPKVYGAFSLDQIRPNIMRDMEVQVSSSFSVTADATTPSSANFSMTNASTPSSSYTPHGTSTEGYTNFDDDNNPNEEGYVYSEGEALTEAARNNIAREGRNMLFAAVGNPRNNMVTPQRTRQVARLDTTPPSHLIDRTEYEGRRSNTGIFQRGYTQNV
jgi:hypothetical protein